MQKTRRIKLLTAVLCCLTTLSIHGHHATSEFLFLTTEFDGTLTSVSWKNPHVELVIQTKEGVKVNFIADTISNLYQLGVRKEMFQVGEKIRIAGRISGKDDARAMAREVILDDGSRYKLWNGR
ncbi:hypothetical protein NBRC116494_05690 [Aurantivibrio plasticivorans]